MCPCGCGASCAEHCWNESEWEGETVTTFVQDAHGKIIRIGIDEDLQADEFEDDNENEGTEL